MFKGLGGGMISFGLFFIGLAIVIAGPKEASTHPDFISGIVLIVGGFIMNKLGEISDQLKEVKDEKEASQKKAETPN